MNWGVNTANMLDRCSLTLVDLYQHYLSPRKGFCCAYRVLYGELSCSAYFRQQVEHQGVWGAIEPLRSRLKACKAAHHVLMTQAEDPEESEESRRRQHHTWDWSDCCYGGNGEDCTPPRACDQDLNGQWDCCEGDWLGCDAIGDCGSCDFFP
ncbi:MAG: membrane protein insertion efficiency factor YidD [Spirulina sp. SIO3F2]|nr:membrane protein insertion efficiency factor YidD [Spirulina sp. SIO3F2]